MEHHSKRISKKLYPLFGIIAAAIIVAIVYFAGATYFEHHFFPDTTINDINVSGMTPTEADEALNSAANDYLLTIYDKDENKSHLKGMDFDYTYTLADSSATILKSQNGLTWPANLALSHEQTLDVTASYDNTKLQQSILALDLLNDETAVAPANAYLSETDLQYQ